MSTPANVETRGPAIQVVCIVFPIIAAIFVALRSYTRVRIVHWFGADDWVAVATLVTSIAYSVCIAIDTHHGMGMHIWDFNEDIEAEYYKWIMIASEFYALSLLGYKTAILLLYIRLFGINTKFKYACWAVIAFNTGYLVSNMILQIFSCTPVQKFYEPNLPGKCVSLIPPDIAWGAMSMMSDFAIAILPVPIVWNLQLPRREKILVSLVFLTGLIAFVMALTRWIIATIDLTSYDRTWIAGLTFLFSIVEVNTGLICGCTPTFKPLFQFARDHSHFSRRKSTSNNTAHSGEKRQLFPLEQNSKRSRHGDTLGSISTTNHTTNDTLSSHQRPSISAPIDSSFSADILHLPREGTQLQPDMDRLPPLPPKDNIDPHDVV